MIFDSPNVKAASDENEEKKDQGKKPKNQNENNRNSSVGTTP